MFTQRLKALRAKQNLSQEAIALAMGINRSTYAGYESGQNEPDFDTLVMISNFHQVTTDYLLGLTDVSHSSYLLTIDEAIFLEGALELYRSSKRLI